MLRTEHKWALICLKFIPAIMFLSMWIYALCGLFGINLWIADTIMGCSLIPSVLILSLSQVFHFCTLHKSLTIYSLGVDVLINIERYVGFGSALFIVESIVVVIGLVLFILLLRKLEACEDHCIYLDFFVAKDKGEKIKICK